MTALVVCLTVLVIVWRVEPYVARLVAVQERQHERGTPRTVAPMPVDLLLSVKRESEGWAQEQAMQRLHEQYDALGSWDAVRQAMSGVGHG